MKYPYYYLPAATAKAFLFRNNKIDGPVAYLTIKDSTRQSDTITYPQNSLVGIKFDNNQPENILILFTQRSKML